MIVSGLLISRLRSETAAAHRRLEEAVNIVETVQNVHRYRRLLEDFHGFHAPVQERLEALAGLQRGGYDPAARRKTQWLEADLAALGLSAAEIGELPVCRDLPPLPDAAAGLGCAYVMEGSTLGGRHIAALLEKSAAIPSKARRFFQGYGAETGTNWREFCAALETAGAENAEVEMENAARAARETFECMERWLNRVREGSAG